MAILKTLDALSDYRARFGDGQGGDDPDVWWEMITPKRAKQLLDKNLGNRSMRRATVTYYATEMTVGRWRVTGDPIRISEEGRVLDGQHRLAAIVKSGVTLKMLVCRLPDAAAMDAIDTGKKRTFSDYLKIQGVAQSVELSTIVRSHLLLTRYLATDGKGSSHMPSALLWQHYQETPESYWQGALKAGSSIDIRRLQMRASLPACYVAFCQNGDQKLADEFVHHLRSGAMLREGDPIYTLRKTMAAVAVRKTRNNMELRGKLMMIVKAWNAWVRGDDMQIIKIAGVPFPKIQKAQM